jgi:endogenous inhibitor of DNA gyrase (YacG/DUF329 family)
MPNNFNQRRRELFCLGYLLVVAIAFRIWILVIESYNTYLEIAASIITFLLFLGVFLRIRRGIRGNHEGEEQMGAENIRDARDIEIARVLLISLTGNRRELRRNSISEGGLSAQTIAALPRIIFRSSFDIDKNTSYDEAPSRCDNNTCRDSISIAELTHLTADVRGSVVNNPINLPFQNSLDCKCPICLDDFIDDSILIRLPFCSHEYHERCIITWLTSHQTCPLCMRSVDKDISAPAPSAANTSSENLPVDSGNETRDLEAQLSPNL